MEFHPDSTPAQGTRKPLKKTSEGITSISSPHGGSNTHIRVVAVSTQPPLLPRTYQDHPQKDVTQEQQRNDCPEGSLPISNIDGADEKPNAAGHHQQPSCLQQEQLEAPKSLFYQENKVQDSQKHQRHSGKQMQESHDLQTQESKKLQTQQHREIETQLNQDLQAQINMQDLQAQKNQELQRQEGQEKQPHKKQELPTNPNKEQQTQQITTAVEAHLSLSALEQCLKKSSTQDQKQPQKHQLSDKNLQERQQEQHIKKQKKKLVGENQERINFLAQASRAMALTAGSPADVTGQRALAAQVGSLASGVGRRCVLRLTPALKRCLCKGCGTALVYGLNARVRHQSRRQKHLVVTCLTCHTIKRFVNDPKHRLWFEQEEALI